MYVIGLPAICSTEELLRKAEYFGQYGKIGKVVIHRNHSATHATISAYVTFTYKEDAKASIQSLEGHWLDGHLLRASFGTTKYCNNFIRGMPCNNPDCVYLHELGEDEDRFTKEEIQAGHSKLVQTPGSNQTIGNSPCPMEFYICVILFYLDIYMEKKCIYTSIYMHIHISILYI